MLLSRKHVGRPTILAWLAAPLAKVGLFVRFGPMTARAYATLVGVIIAERL